ncbi:hypothetical protein JN00_0154 [Metamycoplasma subdolum]|uniref:DUF4177 domain-containing protein n=1 Tax=Metamycoplasma subdolum TaxID=92407 RepID=A0A3M0A297_9BACT|nr:hypothetical protein [Metamycoplasma subdolum]RMA79103.1 hypothetical protein JN00_0154 [Metamycoplasma subdolum]WPB50626.1 hypothetical protein R9C05_00490 [Metamycoplasma subdolum]
MYEYKVMDASSSKDAEYKMNLMAKEGWKVTSVVYWMRWVVRLIITFEREIK